MLLDVQFLIEHDQEILYETRDHCREALKAGSASAEDLAAWMRASYATPLLGDGHSLTEGDWLTLAESCLADTLDVVEHEASAQRTPDSAGGEGPCAATIPPEGPGMALISYREMEFMLLRGLGPDSDPTLHADSAPFPLWLVPPAWRCARLEDIRASMRRACQGCPDTLTDDGQTTMAEVARWLERLDVCWDHAVPLRCWRVAASGDVLVVWHVGTKGSLRSPFREESSPFPLLTSWYYGTLQARWSQRRDCGPAGMSESEVGEWAAASLCIELSEQWAALETLVAALAGVYGDGAPIGTDVCLDFYDALVTSSLPPYREVLQGICGSRALMAAEIALRGQRAAQQEE